MASNQHSIADAEEALALLEEFARANANVRHHHIIEGHVATVRAGLTRLVEQLEAARAVTAGETFAIPIGDIDIARHGRATPRARRVGRND